MLSATPKAEKPKTHRQKILELHSTNSDRDGGILSVLLPLIELRNEYREAMKGYWKERGNESMANLYYHCKEFVGRLDEIIEEA
jgi:hypothetical protein